MSEPKSGADVLARIKPKLREESTQICMRSDLLDEWDALNEQLVEAVTANATASTGRLAGDRSESPKARKLAKDIQELEEKIAESAIHFRFRAMPKDKWRALCDNHPPRKGDEVDHIAGFNRDAVLDQAVRDCMIDPVFEDCAEPGCEHDDCGSWQALVKVINLSEWRELRDTVNSVNRSVVDAPKSELASRILTKRGAGSR